MAKKKARNRTKVSREVADRIGQTLTDLPEKQKTTLTNKEVVFENIKQIDTALEKGYSYDDLVKILAAEEVQLSPATLRQYISEAHRAETDHGGSKRRPAAKQAPSKRTVKENHSLPKQSSPESDFNFDNDPDLVEMSHSL